MIYKSSIGDCIIFSLLWQNARQRQLWAERLICASWWRGGAICHSGGGLATDWPRYLGCSEVDRGELWHQLTFFFLFIQPRIPACISCGHSHSRLSPLQLNSSRNILIHTYPEVCLHGDSEASQVDNKNDHRGHITKCSHGHSWVVRFGEGLFCSETRSHYVVALAVQNSLCNPGYLELTL